MTNKTDQGTAAADANPDRTGVGEPLDRLVLVLEEIADPLLRKLREDMRWQMLRRTGISIIVIFGLTLWFLLYGPLLGLRPGSATRGIAVVPIVGEIGGRGGAEADLLVPRILAACRNERMTALVLRISSPGGSPSDAERIGKSLDACREGGKAKPVVAVIESMGASAAYMIAIQADEVVANRYALVGSIGAVMRTLDASKAAARFGLHERVFASGELKAGNGPLTPNTPQQDAMTQALVDEVAAQFKADVLARRGKKLKRVESVPDLFSGKVWVGPEAERLGLIDSVATYEELLDARFKDQLVNDFAPHQSLPERLGLQSMVDAAVARIWARASTPRLE